MTMSMIELEFDKIALWRPLRDSTCPLSFCELFWSEIAEYDHEDEGRNDHICAVEGRVNFWVFLIDCNSLSKALQSSSRVPVSYLCNRMSWSAHASDSVHGSKYATQLAPLQRMPKSCLQSGKRSIERFRRHFQRRYLLLLVNPYGPGSQPMLVIAYGFLTFGWFFGLVSGKEVKSGIVLVNSSLKVSHSGWKIQRLDLPQRCTGPVEEPI